MIPDIPTPDAHSPELASAFQRGSAERSLRLVIDWESVPAGVGRDVLFELSEHPQIETLGTRSSEAEWVEILEQAGPDSPDAAVVWRAGQMSSQHVLAFGRGHQLPNCPWTPDGTGAQEWRLATGLAHFVQRASFDALVTERPVLYGKYAVHAGARGAVLRVGEAIALAGLFLRSRGEFNSTPRVRWLINWQSAEDFYGALAVTHVPSAELWLAATRPNRSRDLYEETCALGGSVLRQLTRTFRARDKVQILRRGKVLTDTAVDVASEFELALISLSGAFDGLAKLFGLAYGLKKPVQATWSKESWLRNLSARTETQGVAVAAQAG